MDASRTTLDRIQYWQGQLLRAGDFRAEHATEEQLRWWHNRGLHNAYGVGFGLRVSEAPGVQPPAVDVDCGIAYDCAGRELIVSSPRRVALLDTAGPDGAVEMLVIRRGTASSPEVEWVPQRAAESRDVVPLARAVVAQGARALDLSFRTPAARPLARPLIGHGSTSPGNTPWEVWYEDVGATSGRRFTVPLGMQTRIDATASGFTQTPCYAAQLGGALWDRTGRDFFPAFLCHIAQPSAGGFTFRILMRGIVQGRRNLEVRSATVQDTTREGDDVAVFVDAPELFAGRTHAAVFPRAARRGGRQPQSVEILSIEGNKLTLRGTATHVKGGDHLTLAAADPREQFVHFSKPGDLHPGDEIALASPDDETRVTFAHVTAVNAKSRLATILFGADDAPAALAPGAAIRASVVFNPQFAAFFMAFARRQRLHVCWIGCQSGSDRTMPCGGAAEPGPCGGSTA